MRRINSVFGMLLLATMMAACHEAPPPNSEAPVENASQARRNDERAIAERLAQQKGATDEAFEKERARDDRQQKLDAISDVSNRWSAALSEANRTGRSDIGGAIKKLQAVKADAEVVAVDDCTGKARASLTASMSAAIEAYGLFQNEKGDASDASKQKLEAAGVLLQTFQQELGACRLPQ